jgi:nitroimidazol reductase NimA-like FMN-containing flavoprotein (pyridoxamine 5'-phosphate oxidase superfamily)
MFRKIRRNRQVMSSEETETVLKNRTAGVLAVAGDDGYPYAVPLSYVYTNNRIYFHCALEGHKLDAIRRNDKVSFCVIDLDEIHPEELTTYFRSVIVFGRARVAADDGVKRLALEALAEKYSPGRTSESEKSIQQSWDKTCVIELEIDHVSGKKAIELVPSKMD